MGWRIATLHEELAADRSVFTWQSFRRSTEVIFKRWRPKMDAIVTSVNDAAKALSIGRTSIYALIRAGRLETVKLGRRTLITTDSIRRLIEQR
jgi:excisionase family DNA binding protein